MSALTIILVSVGGVFGALLRYVLVYVQPVPVISSVILINVVGSFLIGYLLMHINSYVWAVAAIGFCGAFTTFSTYALDVVQLIAQGQFQRAVLYVFFMNICSLVACWVGVRLAGLN